MHLTAPNGLHGTKLELPYPSVGATEQVLLTAVRAEGVTELRNAAVEPEIIDLICVLQKMGAIITVHTDRVIEIQGVPRLHGYATGRSRTGSRPPAGPPPRWPPRRDLRQGRPAGRHDDVPQRVPLGRRRVRDRRRPGVTGVEGGIRFWHPGGELQGRRAGDRRAPGLHDRLAAAAGRRADPGPRPVDRARDGLRAAARLHRRAQPDGRHDPGLPRLPGRHPCRFGRRNFKHSAVIAGPSKLHAADLVIPDLRAGFSHLIAALAAEGTSRVYGVDLINRGYEDFMEKLVARRSDKKLDGAATLTGWPPHSRY
jgi:UDP-N-acetylglucosamine 1-carboxyvinyltransferase